MRKTHLLSLLLLTEILHAQVEPSPKDNLILGEGAHRYVWSKEFGKKADGTDWGNTHGCVQVDSAGHIYVNTDTEDAVIVFDPSGRVLRTFGKEFKGGLHGMTIVQEGETEFLYMAHTMRHEVVKCTMQGDVVWTLGCPVVSGLYADPSKYAPTSVVVSSEGNIYVADGYGLSWIHQFDKERKYIRSFGGPGTEPGQLRTPHGLLIDTRTKPETLLVADRENQRLQRFDLAGKHLEVISGMFRRPCNLGLKDGFLVVPDLAGRVTILNEKNELVVHLGDQPDPSKRARNGVAKDQWVVGQFLSPHGAAWGKEGDLYVLEWNKHGRIVKLVRQ